MRSINKNSEPKFLSECRCHAIANHMSLPTAYEHELDKNKLRDHLLEEQGYICCYCMRRISRNEMKIEHRMSQSPHPERALDHANLFAACKGNEGNQFKLQCCDTRRGDTEISIDPSKIGLCERAIYYSASGEIKSDDSTIWNDLHNTLNLNANYLTRGRKEKLEAALYAIQKKYPTGTWGNDQIANSLKFWKEKHNGKYEEYCQIVIFFLEKRLLRNIRES